MSREAIRFCLEQVIEGLKLTKTKMSKAAGGICLGKNVNNSCFFAILSFSYLLDIY